MQTTTKMFNKFRNPKFYGLSLEQLSSLYRQQKQDAIVAEAFERVKKMVIVNNRQYPYFETCDTISFALEQLEMCLLTYVPGSRNKFITYFCKVYKNKLRTETQYLFTDKRKTLRYTVNMTDLLNKGVDFSDGKYVDDRILCLPNTLTDREMQYCFLLATDYGSNQEIADHMKVTTMTLCNMRKSLRYKLKHLYN